eukprot:snap_masked-scaffold_6-processed-gene-13.21-mRNA-1 protein AED:0.03 eAED:0.03 QI:0/-1/0/1/-1/1/1/0/705
MSSSLAEASHGKIHPLDREVRNTLNEVISNLSTAPVSPLVTKTEAKLQPVVSPMQVDTSNQFEEKERKFKDKYRTLISLRGKLIFPEGYKHQDLISYLTEEEEGFGSLSQDGKKSEVSWEGRWGMTDSAFSSPSGLTSSFMYTLSKNKLGSILSQEDNEDSNKIYSFVLRGYFNIKNTNNVTNGPSHTKITESETIMSIQLAQNAQNSFDIPLGANDFQAIGTGSNQYGDFKLFGRYNSLTNSLTCFRQYLPRPIRPRVRAKRPRPGSSTAYPPVSPLTQGTLVDGKPKRTKKPGVYHKGVIHGSAGDSSYPQVSAVVRIENDVDAVKLLVDKLYRSDKERWFTQPVDAKAMGLTTYHSIIQHPMDLGTILKKYADKQYADVDSLVDDVRLVFRNAMTFNPPKSPVHTVSKSHLRLFERDLKNWKVQKERKRKLEEKKAKEKKKKQAIKSKKIGSVDFGASQLNGMYMRNTPAVPTMFATNKKQTTLSKMFGSSDEDDSDSSSSDGEDLFKRTLVTQKKQAKKDNVVTKEKPPRKKKKRDKNEQQWQIISNLTQQVQEMSKIISNQALMQQGAMANPNVAGFAPPHQMQQQYQPLPGAAQMHGNIPVSAYPLEKPAKVKKPRPVKELEFQEKQQLRDDIEKLPAEVLPKLVNFLTKLGVTFGDNEEVELDIDGMEPRVLRKLQKWANNELRKVKGRADVSQMTFE